MAYFDRADILAAWNLHLQHVHTGQASQAYSRLCRLQAIFKPSRREEFLAGLSDNAIEIYDRLRRQHNLDHGGGDDAFGLQGIPIANAGNANFSHNLYRMWAGEGFDNTEVYVWADSFESAFEELVEWLDQHAPGRLVSHEQAKEALESYCTEHGLDLDRLERAVDATRFSNACEAVEQANEWTVIGHTSLNSGGHIASHEWGGDDVTENGAEYENVLIASRLESAKS